MVDNINFSRAKKNINRDFADGLMMAELIHHYNPRLVSVHNYPAANSLGKKVENWNTLNGKVLRKLGISLSKQQIDDIVNAAPNVIEHVLYQILIRFERPDEEGRLTQNAQRAATRGGRVNTEMAIEVEEAENKVARRYEFENQVLEGYENYQRQTKEEEELVELTEKIEQAYSQLAKLHELNKVKEDVIRNLEKKLEKYIFA
jgi:hypothetical protein